MLDQIGFGMMPPAAAEAWQPALEVLVQVALDGALGDIMRWRSCGGSGRGS